MKSFGKVAILAVAVGVAVAGMALGSKPSAPTVVEAVKGYAKWKKANPKPVRMPTKFDVLCRAVLPGEIEKAQEENPHFSRTITVYVNAKGEKAMLKGGEFPVGSVVVKEKRDGKDGPVVLSTVMVKREKGYNSSCGDWEFATIDASGKLIGEHGKLKPCMQCHVDQKGKDYVFKTYLNAKE